MKVDLMDAALADRLQFAFTIMFHYLFPIGTMGLAPFVAYYTIRAERTNDAAAGRAADFWTRIFALNFAVGVVTGIPMEFQFGTNWAAFSAKTGSLMGQPLAMEGVYAFFSESIFLGVLLFGKRFVSRRLVSVAAVVVCLGSWLSGYFIVCADGWMQHPVGYKLLPNGQIVLADIAAVLFSPFTLWQYAHVLTAALLAGGFIVAGIGAFYVLARREPELGPRFVSAGTVVALVFSILIVFPTGDSNGNDVTRFQPIKLAAMEGLFSTENGAPLAIIGMPDTQKRTLVDPILVPSLLSFLAYGNFNANVKGLNAYAVELWPPVELTYYAYHIMVGLGTIFGGVSFVAALLLWRRRLYTQPWRFWLWILMFTTPFPYIANEAGWVVTEVGRQPWIVYGLMRTAAGVSPTVFTGETIFTLIGFVGMYFLLGLLFMLLVLREIGNGPSRETRFREQAEPA